MEKFENKSLNATEQKSGYHSPEFFRELELQTFSLVKKIKEQVDCGEYDMLIGDDASGRIPTLILRGIINARNKKMRPESKDSDIKTRFVAGGQVENKQELKLALEKIKSENIKKALVVTEYIVSGKSAERIGDILSELGVEFDVATLVSKKNKLNIPNNSRLLSGKFFGEEADDVEPSCYGATELGGTVKDCRPRPYALPAIDELAGDNSKLRTAIQNKINLTREDIGLLVEKTLKNVWSE